MGRLWGAQKNLVKFRKWLSVGIFLIFLLAVCIPVAWAEEPTPEFLIRQVINTYRSLATYRVTGQIDTETIAFDHGGKVSNLTTRFAILLKKPNGYHIVWEDDFPPFRKGLQGAAWNTGTQAYVYSQAAKGYMKIPTDRFNLLTITGVSSETSTVIPELFFTFFPEKELRFLRLKVPVVNGREVIEGEPCYVLEGRDRHIVFTYWISARNYFIRQYRFQIDNSSDTEIHLEATEEEAKASLRYRGLEPTKERIKKYQQTWKLAAKSLGKTSTQITATHHFSHIYFPDINSEDLEFSVPEGIPLKKDLYELSQSTLDKIEATRDLLEE